MNVIQEYLETALTREVALRIAKLATSAFGESGLTVEQRVTRMLSATGSDEAEKTSGRRFVIWDGRRAIAHARTFVRVVNTADAPLPILALASVCTDPEVRGRGLGAQVTRQAFAQIGQPGWPEVSLFQTPVPSFYEKLNCRIITNRFVNRRADDPEANPWRDGTIMIHPADASWPQGTIDLNGPDY